MIKFLLREFTVLIILLMCTFGLNAQMGTNDPTFNLSDNGHFGNGEGAFAAKPLTTFCMQDDGKVLVGGVSVSYFNGRSVRDVFRMNQDGTVDPTFWFDYFLLAGGNGSVTINSIALQTDGKIIVGGDFSFNYGGSVYRNLIRLESNGALDPSFLPASGFNQNSYVKSVVVDPNDGVYVAGQFSEYNAVQRQNIVHLNSNGSVDTTFNVNNFALGYVNSLVLMADGKLVAAGYISPDNGNSYRNIVRYHSSGSIDFSSNSSSGFNNVVTAIAADGNKLIAIGMFTAFGPNNVKTICRMDSDGGLDTTFNSGQGFNLDPHHISVTSDGKYLVGGIFTSYNNTQVGKLVLLQANGNLDTSLNTYNKIQPSDGQSTQTIVRCVLPISNEKIFVGGTFSKYDNNVSESFAIIDWDGNNALENVSTGAATSPSKIIVNSSDELFFLNSNAVKYKGLNVGKVYKLSANGELDTAFNIPFSSSYPYVTDMVEMENGKMVVVGIIPNLDGSAYNNIGLIDKSGNFDDSIIFSAFNSNVAGIKRLDDGKFLVGGAFSTYGGEAAIKLARLNADGTLDNSLNVGTNFNAAYVRGFEVLNDGRYFVYGQMYSYNGTPANQMVIINADGSLSQALTFMANYDDDPAALAIATDGSVFVSVYGGTNYNGMVAPLIQKFSPTGVLDASFNFVNPLPGNLNIYNLQLLPNGQLIVAFSENINNVSGKGYLMKLNADGSVNGDFDHSRSFITSPERLALQSDGKIIVAGNFVQFDDVPRSFIARVNNCFDRDEVDAITVDGAVLTANISGATSYQWYNCADDVAISGASSPSFTPSENGSYYVVANNGCSVTSACATISNLTIDGLNSSIMTIYPNPTSGQVNVQFSETQSSINVELLDVQGRLMQSNSFFSTDKFHLTFAGLPGMYIMRITSDGGQAGKSIVLQ